MPARDPELVLLHSSDQIAARVRGLADSIESDYAGRELLVVGVLGGAFIFLADLVRQIELDIRIGFVAVSSYGTGTMSSGAPLIRATETLPIEGADVLIVEDILDTGLTVTALIDDLRRRSPRSIRVCVLIDKRERRAVDVTADYVGFELAEGFVVGYGIDYAGKYRQLSEVFRINTGS